MDGMLDSFKNIAKYLSHPLVLVGFVVLLFFKTLHILIESGILPTIAQDDGFIILLDLLRYGFIIGLVTIIAGFGLQFFKVHRTTLTPADVADIVEKLQAGHQSELTRIEANRSDWKQQASEAVEALAKLQGGKEAPPGVNEALKLLKQGKTGAAEAVFRNVISRKDLDIKEAAAAFRHLGAIAFLSDTQQALSAYKRATELEPDNISGWNQLGHLYHRVGKLNKAEMAFRKVEALGAANGDQHALAVAYGNRGNLYQTRGELDQAEAMYRKSLEINEALGHKEGMASLYGNLGILYKTRGELDQAEAMYRKSLEINEALGHKEGMASDYGNLGNLYQICGELDQAEAMHRKSLEIEEALGRKEGMASDYGNLGILYQTRGELDQAEAMYRKSLEINEALGHKEGMASLYGNLGILYKTRGELDQAEAMFRKSLEINEALGRKEGMASDYGNLGILYKTRGELDQAEAMHRKSLEIEEALGRKQGMANQYGNLGNLYQTRGELDQAEAMYRKSLSLFKSLGAKDKIELVSGWIKALRFLKNEVKTRNDALRDKAHGLAPGVTNNRDPEPDHVTPR
ncbi:MAG: tetratricopeptide repeat protein [Sedimenticola sp.]